MAKASMRITGITLPEAVTIFGESRKSFSSSGDTRLAWDPEGSKVVITNARAPGKQVWVMPGGQVLTFEEDK